MIDQETTRTIVGIIGNIISFCLFASPIPTFVKICKHRTVEEFKPDPYLATVLNCLMWIFYGLPMVHPNSFLVVTINGTGLIMEIIYIAIFFIFSSWSKRWKMLIVLIIEIGFVAVIVFVTLTFVHGNKSRSMLVGILCLVFNIIMYTSPLTIMRRVIRSKSVKYMPFYLSLAYFVNGLVWMIYALIPLDPYIAISNGLGALSGLVQLILYATYYSTTPKDEDERISELQLSMP